MKKVFLFLSVLFVACSLHAQDIFKQHGIEREILTLSKGKYEEIFTNEEIVQIGTVLLNTKTNKVVQFLDEETETISFKAEHSSRWLSPDPLARKFPEVNPYAFCNNNPIKFVDPDGRFSIEIHALMTRAALKNSSLSIAAQAKMVMGSSVIADVRDYSKSEVHMDGMIGGYSSITSAYDAAKNSFGNNMKEKNYIEAGVSLHTVADFYAHSNYISLYKEYAEKNGLSTDINDIPTFSAAMKNPELVKHLEEKGLKTGTYEGRQHDQTTTDPGAHGNMNLDSNNSKAGGQAYNNTNTMHEAAKAAAQKELEALIRQLNNY